MDEVFVELRESLESQVVFRQLNWEDDETQDVIDQFSLSSPPASVVADAKGRVVTKFEGARSRKEMAAALKPLLAGGKAVGGGN